MLREDLTRILFIIIALQWRIKHVSISYWFLILNDYVVLKLCIVRKFGLNETIRRRFSVGIGIPKFIFFRQAFGFVWKKKIKRQDLWQPYLTICTNRFVKLWKKRSDPRQRKTTTRKADARAEGRRQRFVPNGLGWYICNPLFIMLDYLLVDNHLDNQVSLYRFDFIEIHFTFF